MNLRSRKELVMYLVSLCFVHHLPGIMALLLWFNIMIGFVVVVILCIPIAWGLSYYDKVHDNLDDSRIIVKIERYIIISVLAVSLLFFIAGFITFLFLKTLYNILVGLGILYFFVGIVVILNHHIEEHNLRKKELEIDN